MTERPILFSGPMVRAILRDVDPKTQTRRVMKPQPARAMVAPHCESGWWMWRVWTPEHAKDGYPSTRHGDKRCPYGVPGDRLWVRETWQKEGVVVRYRATDERASSDGMGWRPSIFMPRWASRITLEVINVRVERLQEITNPDAIAEGVETGTTTADFAPHHVYAYRRLWDTLNAKRGHGWDANPWVWVVEFKRA